MLVLAFLCCGTGVSAQVRQKYEGPYVFRGLDGKARYDYLRLKNDSTRLEGAFEFVHRRVDSLDQTVFYKSEVTGRYQAGKKQNAWKYSEANHRISVNDVVLFSPKTALTSTLSETSAFYAKGMPSGKWTWKILRYENELLTELFAGVDLPFENGKINGAFTLESKENTPWDGLYFIRGFASHGMVDSTWHLNYMRDTLRVDEFRTYDKGFLTRVVKLHHRTGDTLVDLKYEGTLSKLAVLRFSGSSLFKISERDFGIDYIGGFDITDKKYLTQQQGNAYLRNIFESITAWDREIYSRTGEAIPKPGLPLRTKRFEFTQFPADDSLRAFITTHYEAVNKRCEELCNWNTFRLNKRRSESLFRANEQLKLILQLREKLAYVLDKVVSEKYRYFDVYGYMNRQSFGFMSPDTLLVDWNGTQVYIHRDYNAGISPDTPLLPRLLHYMKAFNEETATIEQAVKMELAQLEIGEELEKLQQEILAKRGLLVQRFYSRDWLHEEQEKLFTAVASNLLDKGYEDFLSTYSQHDIEESRIEEATRYLRNLNKLDQSIRPLELVHINHEIICKAYIEEYFDPFTYSSYKRPVKDEILKAGERIFQERIKLLEGAKTVAELQAAIKGVAYLHRRMEQLRSEETRTLERRLRNVTDTAQLATLLGL